MRPCHSRLFAGVVLVACACAAARQNQPAVTPTNDTCPVMPGEPVDPAIFVEYQGRRVWLCCTKCKARWERDPEKYAVNLVAARESGEEGDEQPGDVREPGAGGAGPASSRSSPGSAGPPAAATPAVPMPPTSGRSAKDKFGDFLGRLHPISVHFPIALLVTAALLELIAMIFRAARPREVARVCLLIGAIGAASSAGLGWISADFNPITGELADTLWLHRWLGISAASASVLCVVLMLAGERAKLAFRIALFGCAALVGVTGYFGGEIVRGPNHLFAGLLDDGRRGVEPGIDDLARRWPVQPPSTSRAAADEIRAVSPGVLPAADAAALDRLLFASNNEEAFIARRNVRLARVEPPPAVPESGEIEHPIDRFIRARWKEAGLAEAANPPPQCDDAAFVRRVHLDVIGVIPTTEEAARFFADTRPDKRERLIDELLARDGDRADHWTPFWEDALGSANTELQGGVPTRGNYRQWINDSFRRNTPFDVMAAELIDPSMPGHRAAVGANANGKVSRVAYIKSETHVDTMQSAANVAQVFLGTGMKCASCHSHFENEEWPQQRFLAFAGMFAGNDLEVIRCEAKTGQIVAAAFPFEIPGMPSDVPADEAGRLRRVAQLLTDPLNPRFARSIVNRLWKRYVGLGFFEPVDDFRLDRPPSHPALLDWLAHDFVAHGYDLKHTTRLILTSRTYQTRYDAALADTFDVQRPDQARYFRSPALRRLTAEQLVDSVRVAATQKLDPRSRLYLDTTSTALTRSLGKPASRNEISTGRPDDVAVVQALELLNGSEFHGLVYAGALLNGLSDDAPERAIDELYRAALARPPTPDEMHLAAEYVRSAAEREASPGAPPEPQELIFIDDEIPSGAYLSIGEWPWATDRAFRSGRSHRQMSGGKQVQHFALGAAAPMPVGAADTLFVHVYLDPVDPPRQIMVQWNDGGGMDGGWAHRAYWGEDVIRFGVAGSPSRRPMGPLPKVGEWVRLEIPAAEVGFAGSTGRITGMSFDQVGGTVWWDCSGVLNAPENPAATALGDLLWALFTSPEFQYVR
ncbi:MAG: DUF1553 domain-containing protein [Phycisphaerales bacterium]